MSLLQSYNTLISLSDHWKTLRGWGWGKSGGCTAALHHPTQAKSHLLSLGSGCSLVSLSWSVTAGLCSQQWATPCIQLETTLYGSLQSISLMRACCAVSHKKHCCLAWVWYFWPQCWYLLSQITWEPPTLPSDPFPM